jgi:hypothetical protein
MLKCIYCSHCLFSKHFQGAFAPFQELPGRVSVCRSAFTGADETLLALLTAGVQSDPARCRPGLCLLVCCLTAYASVPLCSSLSLSLSLPLPPLAIISDRLRHSLPQLSLLPLTCR